MTIEPEKVLSLADTEPAQQGVVPADADIDRLKALEPAAWQALFDTYFKKMYSFAYARTGDPQLAEDIASEVFAGAAKGIASYKPTGAPLAAWLYRIARNITADSLEQRRKRPTISVDEIEIETSGWDAQVDLKGDLRQAMTQLTKEQQEVITLRFFNDCSLAEAAAAMNKSVDAIKVLQFRALGALRRAMTPNSKERRR
jgi:RNA polymerase sigma-70 factor (ECF subfamily)